MEVWPDNAATWDTWLAMQTQWRLVAGIGAVAHQGLDYAAIPEAMKMAGVRKKKSRRSVRAGLRIMEQEALKVLNTRVKGT